jgi:nucleoside 2-deoxyribosyltransferase
MKIYIAGKLCTENERELLEKIDDICKSMGFETFLPHRDCGVVAFTEELQKAFEDDVKALKECDFVVAVLNGRVGAGTAWEIGYAFCLNKKIMGIKTDKKPQDAIPELSAMLIKSIDIAESFDELKEKLEGMKK